MGDFYSYIVPQKVAKTEADAVADTFVDYLISKNIILDQLTDCTLGEQGYPPGENWKTVVDHPDGHLLQLKTNGVEIDAGRQAYFSDELDEVKCPDCEANIIEMEWGEAIEEWTNETDNDKITCPECGKTNSIADFVFEPYGALGEAGFTFWNWGAEFKESFINEIEEMLGHQVKIVYGKI